MLPFAGRHIGAMVKPHRKDGIPAKEEAIAFLSSRSFSENRSLQDVHIPRPGAETVENSLAYFWRHALARKGMSGSGLFFAVVT